MSEFRIIGKRLDLPIQVQLGVLGAIEATAPVSSVPETYLMMEDTQLDGPTWLVSNVGFQTFWDNVGGDWRGAGEVPQGATPYTSYQIISTPAQTINVNITSLVAWHLANGNTGIRIHNASGPDIAYSSRRNPLGVPGAVPYQPWPRLVITTSVGVFDCVCLADTWVAPSAGNVIASNYSQMPSMLRFDYTGVVGTLQSAILSLYLPNGAFTTLHFNRLDMHKIIYDTVAQLGGEVLGIANQVTRDIDLEGRADLGVVLYDELKDDNVFFGANRRYVATNLGTGGHSYVQWPELGMTVLRVFSAQSPHVLDAFKFGQDLGSIPMTGASFKRDYEPGQQLGFSELYFRYMMEIGEDVKVGMTELGMKLSTMSGLYEYSSSGGTTLPEPGANACWDIRTWHSRKSLRHPDLYRGANYAYDMDWKINEHPGVADLRWWNKHMASHHAAIFLQAKAGRRLCIEQYIKLNTTNGVVGNPDGIYRHWLDGVLVSEKLNARVRNLHHVNIMVIPKLEIYHGGVGIPASPFHYEIGGICVATNYIGRPKLVASSLPSYVPNPGKYGEFTLNTPLAVAPPNFNSPQGMLAVMFQNWTSSAFIQDFGPKGGIALHGGGSHQIGDDVTGGVLMLDVDTRLYSFTNRATQSYRQSFGILADADYSNDFGEHADGSPEGPHSYNCNCELRSSWRPGYPRGGMARVHNSAGNSSPINHANVTPGSIHKPVPLLDGPGGTFIGNFDPDRGGNSACAVHLFDVNQPILATVRLTPQAYTGEPLPVSNIPQPQRIEQPVGSGQFERVHNSLNYGGACEDYRRQGWWGRLGTNGASHTLFTRASDGATFYSPTAHQLSGNVYLYHFNTFGQDVLFMAWADIIWVLNLALTGPVGSLPSIPSALSEWKTDWAFQQRFFTGEPLTPNNPLSTNFGCWSTIMNCFVGAVHNATGCKLWYLKPSNPASIMTSSWVYSTEIITSGDGSVINFVNDPATANELTKKMHEIVSLKSLAFSRGPTTKGQLIRPLAML